MINMLVNHKANLLLTSIKEDENGGDPKDVRITLSNLRRNLSPIEVREVGEAFR